MKKVLILLLFILTLCGCEYKSKYNEMDINKLFDTFLANNTNLANHSTNGYKYYLPRGVKVVKSKEYNEELYSNGNYYSLGKKIGKFGFSVQKKKKRYKK